MSEMAQVNTKALFVYMPVVHAEILKYIRSNPEVTIILLDNIATTSVNKFLERDIRALSAIDVKSALEVYGCSSVLIADHTNIHHVLSDFEKVYIPKDEIIIAILTQFAPTVTFEEISLFLRWTKLISTQEHEVQPHRIMSNDELIVAHMHTLENEAQNSPDWWRQIGAGLLKGDELVVVAHNAHFPSQHALTINGDPRSNLDAGQGPGIYTSIHAEAAVIAKAARTGVVTQDLDMVVTTFPCPTCARAIVEAGIKRVFYRHGYSLLDAEEILSVANIEIIQIQ